MQYAERIQFKEHTAANGVRFLTAPTVAAWHAFTTRAGGVSTGFLASLNLGENRGDDPERVRENYRRLGEATGIDTARIVFPRQEHGSAVRTVTAADVHTLFTPVPYEADGLVTDVPGLTLIVFTADCVPVLLCDETAGVIASVHCGWRSSVADILGAAVGAMRALGAEPARIGAAIGPAISQCCFEVGPEVVEAAARYLGEPLGGLVRDGAPGKYLLDLKGANARRLVQLGLREDRIAVSPACTRCLHETYWSHRWTNGRRGSQGAIISL